MGNSFSKRACGVWNLDLPINYEIADWRKRKQAREQYCKEQDWLCYHCGESLYSAPPKKVLGKSIDLRLFPATMFVHPIHLHHCHKTGMTIGAVHARCNAVLWQYNGE